MIHLEVDASDWMTSNDATPSSRLKKGSKYGAGVPPAWNTSSQPKEEGDGCGDDVVERVEAGKRLQIVSVESVQRDDTCSAGKEVGDGFGRGLIMAVGSARREDGRRGRE